MLKKLWFGDNEYPSVDNRDEDTTWIWIDENTVLEVTRIDLLSLIENMDGL